MTMDFVNKIMNVAFPPAGLLFLSFIAPPYYFSKYICSVFRRFTSENVRGKVVLVTGASSGIGEQISYQYAKMGASLALVARREQSLNEVADRARQLGSPDVLAIPADVSRADECKRFVDETVDHFGRLDHLVNNAGILCISMFEEATDITTLSPVMDINFWGAIYPTYHALPHLKRSRGKIVVTASSGSILNLPRMSLYNASKAALVSFYETLRIEVSPEIKITIATPAMIESEITKGKFLDRSGKMRVEQDARDVEVGPVPVAYAEDCAKAIVCGACRGKRCVTVPSWFRVFFLYRLLLPEFVEWCYRVFYIKRASSSRSHLVSKVVLDTTGAKKVLFPESIQKDEVKTD
ncbi:11-beta-hydroxysteroid dehydrogenase A-like [Nymphaea colorata]|nr:11-beta-hydroxysteroid dehydrogenase A-like [Nymphaea colorata]